MVWSARVGCLWKHHWIDGLSVRLQGLRQARSGKVGRWRERLASDASVESELARPSIPCGAGEPTSLGTYTSGAMAGPRSYYFPYLALSEVRADQRSHLGSGNGTRPPRRYLV
ncbi:hypothetical protein B0T16DRAFT_404246, partial [Cercophora newfieldiana]